MGPRFKLNALTLAILGTGSSGQIWAQEESDVERQLETTTNQTTNQSATPNAEDDELEVITVGGFRGSLLRAMAEKRNSKNVSDSIFAEDIGKSTDQNIADALSRVTGVSVQTEDGEGTKITVRGADPNQNMITLNGVQLTSSDFNQAVDLSAFSSDILSSITVVKTPSADHDEGSLGASVELRTAKPLDLTENKRAITVQGRYNDFSDETDYKVSGTFSHKFLDERLGFLITAYDETNSTRRDQISIDDFQARDVVIARDQNGEIVTDTRVITPTTVDYQLYENQRDRQGATTTIQFLPTDSSSLTLDLNYSKFSGTDVFHGAFVRNVFPARTNFFEGVPHDQQRNGQPFVPTFTDPQQDWWTIDTESRTMLKALNRFADGGYKRRNTSEETTNKQASFRYEQEVTDDIRFELGANYSKTSLTPEPSFSVNVNNQSHNPAAGRLLAGPVTDPHTGIQPAGYDCTSGVCEMVFGDGLVSINNPFDPFDNTSRTAWNPQDLRSHSTNTFEIFDQSVDDEIKTAYVDFDWDVDFAGINQIEFGAKFRKRNKRVDDQTWSLQNSAVPVVINRYDADGNIIGQRTLQGGDSLLNVTADNFAFDGTFPHSDFLQDLGVSRNAVTNGWPLISAEALANIAFDIDNLQLDPNPAKFREADLEDKAAYVKFNFEYQGGRLTGDVGVRYIETDVLTAGSSGATFATDPLGRVFDPFLFRQLRDFANNPECEIDGFTIAPNGNSQFNRIDGLGWDLTQDPPVRLPADPSGYPCYDPTTAREFGNQFWLLGRHADISRSEFYRFGDDPNVVENRRIISFDTSGENTYDMFLPSLNLNYQIQDDLIGRFAVSKTISRPNIDSLKPGFSLNENYWAPHDAPSGSITLNNPQLMPQESRNLDLSLEWYFNKTGLLAAAIFVKDMTNFEENEDAIVYADDLRHVDLDQPYDVGQLVLSEAQLNENLANPDLIDGVGPGACFPDRGHIFALNQDWWFDDSDLKTWCSEFNITRTRNGKGAKITGVELSYQQNYDFLPGIWSGLGVQMNYTYQDSETDAEVSTFDENVILPQFPRAWTPEHSYNATLFWEKWGHQIRLAIRGKSDELERRTWRQGSLWREGSINLDLSASYQVTENIRVSFQALNLTDEETRTYFTSRTIDLGDTTVIDGETVPLLYDEGNPLEDSSVTTSRTQRVYKNGRTFRLDVRVDF